MKGAQETSKRLVSEAPARDVRSGPAAVIEIGTSSVRMSVAQPDEQGGLQILEHLEQPLSLGKDTFAKGRIGKDTSAECVSILRRFKEVLEPYSLNAPDQIRVVATTAVREARNREAFLDRLYIATGLQVALLEDAEVTRHAYLGSQRLFEEGAPLYQQEALVMEVGGGSTELLLMNRARVSFSQGCRLGSLRLRELLKASDAPAARLPRLMESQIERSLESALASIDFPEGAWFVALGGDMRFAAQQIVGQQRESPLKTIGLKPFQAFVEKVATKSVDELVTGFHLTFPEAEGLAPALLAYLYVARTLRVSSVHVARTTMREGLLLEMISRHAWSAQVQKQIIQSAIDLGRKFQFDEMHGTHVAVLSKILFEAMQEEHGLDARSGLLLYVAALLHEVGLFVSNVGHHKHSMYLIQNSELFGLGRKDIGLVALVARYHRKATPSPLHPFYGELDRQDRVAVAKMAAILRVADALERSHHQHIQDVRCRVEPDHVVIEVPHVHDLTLEQMALREKGNLFEEIYGRSVVLRKKGY